MKVKLIPDKAFNNIETLEQALDLTTQKWYNLSHCKCSLGAIKLYNQGCGFCTLYSGCKDCPLYKASNSSSCPTSGTLYHVWDNISYHKPEEKQKAALQLYKLLLKIRRNLRRKKRKDAKVNKE